MKKTVIHNVCCVCLQTMDVCALCGNRLDSGEKTVVPHQRGRDTINRASQERGDSVYLHEGRAMHEQCRCLYTNKNNIIRFLRQKQDETDTSSPFTKSAV